MRKPTAMYVGRTNGILKEDKIPTRLLLAINGLEKYNNKNTTCGRKYMRTKTRQQRSETSLPSLANLFNMHKKLLKE
jgi:hypothetical protein